jgi:hypothetical protein
MNRFLDRLLWHLSSGLESPERLAVVGDPDESGRSFAQAALDGLGLLMRRHAALWEDWQPRLILVTLIVPVAALLTEGL